MAEVLAVGASIVAVVQLADRIVGLCKFYIEGAKDAISHLRPILVEISSLKAIFESLKYLGECGGVDMGSIRSMSGVDGPIEGCRRSLMELERLIPPNSFEPHSTKGSRTANAKSVMAVLAWPFKENKARKILQEIAQYKSTINLALTADFIQDVRHTKAMAEDIHNKLTESQRREIYQLLQVTNPSGIHYRNRKDYEPGTGEWVLRCPEWTQLVEGKHRCLWVHGIPGSGKTVLMSYLAEEIEKRCKTHRQQKITSVYYYCYFGHEQDEAEPFLKWLISELCQHAKFLPIELEHLYLSNDRNPPSDSLLDILAETLSKYKAVYITLDAIDESRERENILQILQTLITDSRFEKIHMLASSREYADIDKVMRQFSMPLSMSNDSVEQDIKLLIGSMLNKRSEFQRWPNYILEEVKEALSKGAEGMFRWAVCQIDILRRLKCDPETIRQTLRDLPRTINETYDRIFSAIPAEEHTFVHHVLQWIIFDPKINYGEGMPTTIVIDAVEASISELTGRPNVRYYDMDTLQDFCGCLVKVYSDSDDSTELSLVLAHYTVREYLEWREKANTANLHINDIGKNLTRELMKLVLQRSQDTRLYKSTDFSIDKNFPYGFSTRNLGFYYFLSAVRCLDTWPDELAADDQIQNLVIQMMHPSSIHFKTMKTIVNLADPATIDEWFDTSCLDSLIWSIKWSPVSVTEAQHLFNLVFILSSTYSKFGEAYSVGLLQSMKFEEFVNVHIRLSMHLLPWIGTRGDFQDNLYERGSQIDFQSTLYEGDTKKDFQGTLYEVLCLVSSAYFSNFPQKYIVERGIKLSDPSKILLLSASDYKSSFLKQLIDLGTNPDFQTYRVTPLQLATACGHHECVEVLLKAGADPNNNGNPGGEAWEETNIMSGLNQLHGHSPLYIARFLRRLEIYFTWNVLPKYEECEILLLEHGATAFKITAEGKKEEVEDEEEERRKVRMEMDKKKEELRRRRNIEMKEEERRKMAMEVGEEDTTTNDGNREAPQSSKKVKMSINDILN